MLFPVFKTRLIMNYILGGVTMARIVYGKTCETNLEGATVFGSAGNEEHPTMATRLSTRKLNWLRNKGYDRANQKERERLMNETNRLFKSEQ
jgi:hypothetical protein